MTVEFDSKTPIYLQIINLIRHSVVAGTWPAGSKIDSVRDLAIEFGVNPNTVQRALSELERDGLVYAERTAGRFITSDKTQIERLRNDIACQQIERFLEQMTSLGYEKKQIMEFLQQKWSEPDGHD